MWLSGLPFGLPFPIELCQKAFWIIGGKFTRLGVLRRAGVDAGLDGGTPDKALYENNFLIRLIGRNSRLVRP